MSNILITGATGRSGSYFIEELIKNDINTDNYYRMVLRSKTKSEILDNSQLRIDKVFGDLSNYNFCTEITKNIDTILHIAGIKLSMILVKAAIQNNVKRIILVHTTGIYSKYKNAAFEYLDIEKSIYDLVSDKDINLTILRPTMIFGSLDDNNMCKFIHMVNKYRVFPIVKEGKYLLQPVHQKDLGRAYLQVLSNPVSTSNKSYTLSGQEAVYLIDILRFISDSLGKKTLFISVPFRLAYLMGNCLYYVSFKRIDYREKIQRLVEDRAYDHESATKEFDYQPMDFRKALKEEIELFINSKK
jgi:nucleoside-diphosphate-sugar epimerase